MSSCWCRITVPLPLLLVLVYTGRCQAPKLPASAPQVFQVLIASNMWPPTPCAGIHEGSKDVLCVYNPSIPQIRSTTMFAFTLLVAIRLSLYQHPLHVQCLFYQFHVHRAAATHVTAHVTFNTVGSGTMPLCVRTRVSQNNMMELEMTLKVCRGDTKTNGDAKTDGATHKLDPHFTGDVLFLSLLSLSGPVALSLYLLTGIPLHIYY